MVFIKLVKEGTPKYALYNYYDIRDRGNELYGVVLKQFAQMMVG